MYKPKTSFLKLNDNYNYMGGLQNTNTLKRYSQPIFETNNPPPKKVKIEEVLVEGNVYTHLNSLKEIQNIYDQGNKTTQSTKASTFMDIEEKKSNSTIFGGEKKIYTPMELEKIGYLDGVTKNNIN